MKKKRDYNNDGFLFYGSFNKFDQNSPKLYFEDLKVLNIIICFGCALANHHQSMIELNRYEILIH